MLVARESISFTSCLVDLRFAGWPIGLDGWLASRLVVPQIWLALLVCASGLYTWLVYLAA